MQPIIFIGKLSSFFKRILNKQSIYKEYNGLNLALIDADSDEPEEILSNDGDLLEAVFEDVNFKKPEVYLAEQTTGALAFPFVVIRKSYQSRNTIFPEQIIYKNNIKQTLYTVNFGVTITAHNKNTQGNQEDLNYGLSEMYLDVLLNHFLNDAMNFCDNQVSFIKVSRFPLNTPISIDGVYEDICTMEIDFKTNSILEEEISEAKHIEVNLIEKNNNLAKNINTENANWNE